MLKKILLILALLSISHPLKAEITGVFTYPGGSSGDVQINGDGVFEGRTLTAGSNVTITTNSTSITINSTGGGGGSSNLDGLTDVTITGPSVNQTLIYNGSQWVNAAQGTSYSFSIASFGDSLSATQEIGSGVWKGAGAITFTATYTNGPPTSSTITFTGWSNLAMASPFATKVSAQAVNYPSVGGSVVFNLNSAKSAESSSTSITHTFVNRIFYGVSTVASGYTEANIEGLAGTDLQDSKSKTFSVSPGASEYIIFAYPTRLGTATFTVGGFAGGFQSPATVSITNASGYTENYYAYRSTNLNLGSTTVVAQ